MPDRNRARSTPSESTQATGWVAHILGCQNCCTGRAPLQDQPASPDALAAYRRGEERSCFFPFRILAYCMSWQPQPQPACERHAQERSGVLTKSIPSAYHHAEASERAHGTRKEDSDSARCISRAQRKATSPHEEGSRL